VTLSDAFSLTGQVAIVTGAGRGIGAQTAKTYAEAGADLVLAARTKEQLDAIAAEVRGFGRRALVIPCDANENESLEDVVAQTMAEFGRIDVVVNNAGGTMPRPFMDTSAGYSSGRSTSTSPPRSCSARPRRPTCSPPDPARSSTSPPRSAASVTAVSSPTARPKPRSRI
jgi:NAD(P)-dependent dehydrogenase (short-subunit alcohol dehydrogenase family)